MSVMNYVSSEIKIIAVKHSLVGTESLNQSAARFGVSRSTLQKWLLNYEMFGTEGLCHRAGNHHYSKEIKREAVEAYLALSALDPQRAPPDVPTNMALARDVLKAVQLSRQPVSSDFDLAS